MLVCRVVLAVRVLSLAVALALCAGASWAQTASESFQYSSGVVPGNGGSGWAGPWVSNQALVVSPGLTHPSLAGSGNALGPTPGSAAIRTLASPIVGKPGVSLVLRALVRSSIPGTSASQATLGNSSGGTFTIGDLPMQAPQAKNWGLQNAAGTFYSAIPVAPGTTLVVAQIDFEVSGANDRMRLWVDPPPNHLAATPAIDVTNAHVSSFSGIYWQTQQSQIVDEIRISAKTKCTSDHLVLGGVEDGFAGSPEAAHSGLALQSAIGPAGLNFDQIPGVGQIPTDQRFAHTLTFFDLAAREKCGLCRITDARLRIGLQAAPRPSGLAASNDSLALKLPASGTPFLWTHAIAGLPGAGGTWGPGQGAIVTLNLAALPPSSIDIVPAITDGRLEVYLQDDTGVDFVELQLTTECDCTEIHGSKFYDRNENGIRDPGEIPLGGWTLELRDQTGTLLGTATTDAQGAYSFTGVPPGTNSIQEVLKPGWHVTQPASGVAVVETLPGEIVNGIDFGNSDLWCGIPFDRWSQVVLALPDQQATGTANADLIIGTPGDDWLKGNAGDDCIYGLGGDDYLKGDSGADEIHGGAGNDYLKGDSGQDRLFGDDGNDKLKGDSGADELHGGPGSDFLMGDAGADKLFSDEGDDRLCGNAGPDVLDGGPGDDRGQGGAGSDSETSVEHSLAANQCTASSFNSYPL